MTGSPWPYSNVIILDNDQDMLPKNSPTSLGSTGSSSSWLSPLGLSPALLLPSLEPRGWCGLQWRPSTCSSGTFLLTNTQATRVSTHWGSSMSIISHPTLCAQGAEKTRSSSPLPRDGKAQQANLRPLRTVLSFLFKRSFNTRGNLRGSYQYSISTLNKNRPFRRSFNFPKHEALWNHLVYSRCHWPF